MRNRGRMVGPGQITGDLAADSLILKSMENMRWKGTGRPTRAALQPGEPKGKLLNDLNEIVWAPSVQVWAIRLPPVSKSGGILAKELQQKKSPEAYLILCNLRIRTATDEVERKCYQKCAKTTWSFWRRICIFLQNEFTPRRTVMEPSCQRDSETLFDNMMWWACPHL